MVLSDLDGALWAGLESSMSRSDVMLIAVVLVLVVWGFYRVLRFLVR